MDGIYRVGVIGCGGISRMHANWYRDFPLTEIVAIADVSEDNMKKFAEEYNVQKTYINYIEMLEKEKPDIAFGMMHYPSALLVFAEKFYKLNCRIIVSPRGPSIEYLKHFENKILRKVYLKFVFSFFCNYADGIIVASRGMREECVRYFQAKENKIVVVPNSVNISEVALKSKEKVNLNIPFEYKILSASGRLEKEKNLQFLLQAFFKIRQLEKVKLIIIGDGTERYNLEKLAKELEIFEDIIFTGYQINPYKYISISDIFIHTCLFEGFANSIIEAMACGVPVISVNCPYGPDSIINDGENGLLIPPEDESSLVRAVLQLLYDENLRRRLILNSAHSVKKFSIDKMISGYENFIEKIING
ncbi:TPA: glycosyltransferase [bacterium]|nr:glycosyltransferase [bacterium]